MKIKCSMKEFEWVIHNDPFFTTMDNANTEIITSGLYDFPQYTIYRFVNLEQHREYKLIEQYTGQATDMMQEAGIYINNL